MLREYLLRVHKDNIWDILSTGDITKHHSINIPFVHLWEEDLGLAQLLLNTAEDAYKILNKQLQAVQDEILNEFSLSTSTQHSILDNYNSFQGLIHVRVYDLHFCSELNRHVFPLSEETSYLQVSGTVTRISAVKLLRFKRDFECQKCKECTTITAAYEQKYTIIAPRRCSNGECNGIKLVELEEMQQSYSKDYQEIKIQEDLTLLGSGVMPNSMWVTLEDDLADVCKPGDSVTVCGIVKRRWSAAVKGKRAEVSLALKAHHVAINNIPGAATQRAARTDFAAFWRAYRDPGSGEELRGRDVVLRSFSPEIHGLYLVKLAGGGGGGAADTRAEPHLLLVGDPGTGKSQLLRHAGRVIPRSVCTTGIGSTSAGLTVTTIMEDGEWQLEAGALVLSDGGICCIDEFHTMRGHDRTSIHEAMEQQSISVAKASIVCKLNTRCSILAAANPQGPADANQPQSCNIALTSPILSRFDLILMLKDRVDVENDTRVADFILRSYRDKPELKAFSAEIWSLDTLKDYYLEIRKRKPSLTPRVTPILNAYYQYRRRSKFRNEARTTVRLLDSLARLSKAHAKLMYREEVSVVDAVMAIALLEASTEADSPSASASMFDVQIDFPDDPAAWYRRVESVIVNRLQLDLTHLHDASQAATELAHEKSNNIHGCTTRLNTISATQSSSGNQAGQIEALEENPYAMQNNGRLEVAEDSIETDQVHNEIRETETQQLQKTVQLQLEQVASLSSDVNEVDLPFTVGAVEEDQLGKKDVVVDDDVASIAREENATQMKSDVTTTAASAAESRSSLKRRFGFLARSDGESSTNANEVIQLEPSKPAHIEQIKLIPDTVRNPNSQHHDQDDQEQRTAVNSNIFSMLGGELDDNDLEF